MLASWTAPPRIGEELQRPALLGDPTWTVGILNRPAPKTMLASPRYIVLVLGNSTQGIPSREKCYAPWRMSRTRVVLV
jgi:hypothetical protein